MSWLKNNAIGLIPIIFVVVGGIVNNAVSVSVMSNRLQNVETAIEEQTNSLVLNNQRVNKLDTNSAVTNTILNNLVNSIEEFSKNTKTLTDSVVRLEVQVQNLERKDR